MKLLAFFTFSASIAMASPALAEPISGTAQVIDGTRMRIAGQEVTLNAIAAPRLGESCLVRSRQMDCGKLARAGLMDITAGARVECRPAGNTGHLCTADGYDLSFGQLHAGWAVALPGAPKAYRDKMAEAHQRKRGLWAARSLDDSAPYALQVKH